MERPRTDTERDGTVCPRCGTRHVLDDLEANVRYLCGRCDAPLAGPQRSSYDTLGSRTAGVRWLYGRASPPPPPPLDDLVEETPRRIGRYAIRAELGRGGMGVVYRAWDADLGREVALKVLLAGPHSAQEQVERFLREARAAAKLDHPNLVRVHDIGFAAENVYFTMDLVEGPSLQEVLASRGRLPVSEALRIAAALGRALWTAHQRGLVHRDVKPANVLLRPNGTPLLADFGLATELAGADPRLTKSGQLMGTPAYMAPEQTQHAAQVGPLTDQYALGAVLYEMLCGTPPYRDEHQAELLYAIIAGPPQPLRERMPEVPRDVALMVETAMAREPERRYPTMLAFAEDLDRWLRGEPIYARPPSLAYRARWAIRRNRAWLALGVTALVAAIVAGQAVSVVRNWRETRAEEEREAEARRDLARVRERLADLHQAERVDDARALLVDFAEDPARRGTQSAVQALFDAARLVPPDDADGGIDAWAAAYAAARTGADQATALRGLAGRFRAAWRWDALTVVLDTLVDRNPALATDPEIALWRGDALLALRRPADARAALRAAGRDVDALVGALSGGVPVPHLDGHAFREADFDGDGVDEWWVATDDELFVVRAAPGLPTVRRLPLPEGPLARHEVFPVTHDPPLVVVRRVPPKGVSQAVLLEVAEDALVPVYAWPESRLVDALATDLDRDGRREVYVGVGPYTRRLVRLERAADGAWRRSSGDPGTDATASDVVALATADLDGDARDELVVAAGAWNAYDVRALRARGGGVERLARRKLGFVPSLRRVEGDPDRLWVAKSDEYPSAIVFPPDRSFGEPPGAYLLSLADGALVTERFLPRPGPRSGGAAPVDHVVAADLDGDGADEVILAVLGARPATAIWPGGAPDEVPIVLGGVLPHGAANLDSDPAEELLVRVEGAGTWVLGIGDAPLPPLAEAATAREPVPELRHADPAALRTWARAEDLVGMGLVERAVDELERLGETVRDRAVAGPVQHRAAVLAESLGDDLRAARLYAAAAAAGEGAPALAAAARQHLHGHRFEEAIAVLADLATGSGAEAAAAHAEHARLVPLVATTRTSALSFDVPLPSEVDVRDPVAVRADPAGHGLRIIALADDGELVRVPFRWTSGRLGLEVELELQRLEWGGGLRIALAGPDGDLGFEVRGWGGGNVLEREVVCVLPEHGERPGRRAPVDGPADTVRMKLAIDVSAVTNDVRCALTIGSEVVRDRVPLSKMPAAGEWELRIAPSSHGAIEGPAASVALVRRVTLTGTGLALGGPSAAEPDPRRLAVWKAVALADEGRWDEAIAAVRALPRDPEVDREIRHGVRTRLATFGPVLREAIGDRYWAVFQAAWDIAVHQHPDDVEVQRALTTGLGGLYGVPAEADVSTRRRAALLLIARGRAWAGVGETAAARRDLSEATRILEALLGALGGDESRDSRSRLATAWIDLAELAALEGETAAAREAIGRAIAAAAAPEIAADQVRARGSLAPFAQNLP